MNSQCCTSVKDVLCAPTIELERAASLIISGAKREEKQGNGRTQKKEKVCV